MAQMKGTGEFSREQVIVDGFLKHRETGIVTRWRHRYVVFKIANAGRLTFTIYKDQPAIPTNELSEIPIEEFGGLDSTLKLDGEKHVFAIISTNWTDCFATDSAESLQEWTKSIQDFLGKELVLNITIPYKQNMLKPGRGQIRIRNTGFTITNSEIPPRCQGSWQILHIRKFGGSEQFRFETGSKCPTGEFLYVINTEDNEKMKTVFNDLSLHKPIFKDDRMGRRMTQEHEILRRIRSKMDSNGPHHKQRLGPRLSLNTADPHSYENQSNINAARRISVQHESSRSRSNAIHGDEMNSRILQASPSLPHITERSYYNFHEVINSADKSRLHQLSTVSTRASSDPPEDHIYYNQETALRLGTSFKLATNKELRPSKQKTIHSAADSGEESDDDFVDVAAITSSTSSDPEQVIYYNLRDSLKSNKEDRNNSRVESFPQSNYENVTPTHHSGSRSSHGTSSSEESLSHLYTNVTLPIKDNDVTNSSPLFVVTTSPCSPPPAAVITTTTASGNGSLTSYHKEDIGIQSDPEIDDSTLRRRTTSIVGNLMISADHNSRSCEDLSKIEHSSWSEMESLAEALYSDSNFISIYSKEKTDKEEEIFPANFPPTFQNRNGRKSPRPSPYDHLVPLQRSESPIIEFNISTSSKPDTFKDDPGLILVDPEQDSTYNRKVHITRRQHTYEDVDLHDEDDRSSSSSPESSGNTPEHQVYKMTEYNRKVSLLGHGHSYEYVELSKQSNLRSTSSSPDLLSQQNQRAPSPSRNLAVSAAKNSVHSLSFSRPPLPMQESSLDEGTKEEAAFLQGGPTSEGSPRHRLKKPVPTPRKINKGRSVDESSPRLSERNKSYTFDETSNTGEQYLINNHTQQHHSSPAHSPKLNDSKFMGGVRVSPFCSVKDEPSTHRPHIPPKKKSVDHSSHQFRSQLLKPDHRSASSDEILLPNSSIYERKPAIPPKLKKEDALNYIPVFVNPTLPAVTRKYNVDLQRFSSQKREKDSHVKYTDINHFLTRHVQTMREERELEKGLCNS